MDRRLPFNRDAVDTVMSSVTDPIVKNLMSAALGVAILQYSKPPTMTDAEFDRHLPRAPFDMAFFAAIMKDLFSQRTAIEAILKGKSVAQATGWGALE